MENMFLFVQKMGPGIVLIVITSTSFGGKKIPELMRGLAKALKNLKMQQIRKKTMQINKHRLS